MAKRSGRRKKPANANKKSADAGGPAAQSSSQPARPPPQVEQKERASGSKPVAKVDKHIDDASKAQPKTGEKPNPTAERAAVVMGRLANLFANISGDLVAQMATGAAKGKQAEKSAEMAAVDRGVERAEERSAKPTVEAAFEPEDGEALESASEAVEESVYDTADETVYESASEFKSSSAAARPRTHLQDLPIPIWRLSPRRYPHRYTSELLAASHARLLHARTLIKRFHRTFSKCSPYPSYMHDRILAFLTTQLDFWDDTSKELVVYIPGILHVRDGNAAYTVFLSKGFEELTYLEDDLTVTGRERHNATRLVGDRFLCRAMAAWVKELRRFYENRMLEEEVKRLNVEIENDRVENEAAREAQTKEVDGIVQELATGLEGGGGRSRATGQQGNDASEPCLVEDIQQVFKKRRSGAAAKEPETRDLRDLQWLSERHIRVRETKKWISRMENEQIEHEMRERPRRATMLRIAGGLEAWARPG